MQQLEQRLRQLCHEEQIPLYQQYEIVKEYAMPKLREVERACQKAGYTYHGIKHINELGKQLDRLIPASAFGTGDQQINVHELFILMAAAYLHDLGMLRPEERATHNLISAQLVYDDKTGQSDIKGVDSQYTYRVSKICLAHRDYKQDGVVVDTLAQVTDNHLAGRLIKMRLLACLFRLADELDSDFERAPEDLELSLPLSDESQLHWQTHQLIDSFTINAQRWEIELYPSERAQADTQLLQLVRNRRDKIQHELDRMQPILRQSIFAYKDITLVPARLAPAESAAQPATAASVKEPKPDQSASVLDSPAETLTTSQQKDAPTPMSADQLRILSETLTLNKLVNRVLACPSIDTPGSRPQIVQLLPTNIRHSIQQSSNNRAEVMGIVRACLNYLGGIEALVVAIGTFDSGTMQLAELEAFLSSYH